MTFEGVIIGTDERDSTLLREDLERWATNEPTITVEGQQLKVVAPKNNDENDDSEPPSVAIGVSIAAVMLLLLALSVTAVAFLLYFKCYRHKR